MQPTANIYFYRGPGFQNATEFGNKSTIPPSFSPRRPSFGRILTINDPNLKEKIATLRFQRTDNEKTRLPDHFPLVHPPPGGPDRRCPLAELQHRRRTPRQFGPFHLPGQRRTIMAMHARGHLHVRRPAFQTAGRPFLRFLKASSS